MTSLRANFHHIMFALHDHRELIFHKSDLSLFYEILI